MSTNFLLVDFDRCEKSTGLRILDKYLHFQLLISLMEDRMYLRLKVELAPSWQVHFHSLRSRFQSPRLESFHFPMICYAVALI